MAKFHGLIGYYDGSVESKPGVWTDKIIEKPYFGEVIQRNNRWQSGEGANDNLVLNNTISIVCDTFAYENLQTMRYVKWTGESWKITNVEISRPRLILTLGGIYNGEQA